MALSDISKKYELLGSSYFFCPRLGQTVNLDTHSPEQIDQWFNKGYLSQNLRLKPTKATHDTKRVDIQTELSRGANDTRPE